MAPKIFRLYTQENVVVLPLTEEAFLLEIKANDQVLFTKYFPKSPKNPFSVPIELGANVSTGVAKLSVINRDGDENSSQIIITGDTGFGFIQTDKPIYTPKEKVRIRLMRLDDDLKPMADKVKLSIKNPHKIIMDEVVLESSKDNYFINHEFNIPPHFLQDPVKNKWTIIMAYGPEFQVTSNATFEVREYILPLFQVTLKSLQFITPSTSIVNGSVKATYLTGKPVTGTVRFKFKIRDSTNRSIGIGQTDELELVKGETSYKFSTNEFSESGVEVSMIIGSVLVVEATVIEAATRQKVKHIDSSTYFVSSPYKVSFESSFRVFRPEHPIRLIAEIYDVHNQPVVGIPVRLSVFSSRMVTKDVISDDLGRVTVDYDTTTQDKKIIFEVRTRDAKLKEDEQSFSRLLVEPSNQTSAALTLVEKNDRFKVGDKYTNSIIFEGSTFIFSQAYYITVVRGRIDKLERIPDNDNFGFTIEPHMAPSFRLIAISYRYDRVVSDSLLINVDPPECSLNLTYTNSKGATNDIEPGENGTLIVSANQSENRRQISIVGVDEAVYLLRSANTLTRHGLRKMFNSKDKGCGPGGGIDPTDVLLNSGLVIAGIPSNSIGSSCVHMNDKSSKRRPIRASPRIYITSSSSSMRKFASSPTYSSHSASPVSSSKQYSTNAFINQCCRLGKIKPNDKAKAMSCEERRDILLRSVKNVNCASAFLDCCLNSIIPPLLRTSVFDVSSGESKGQDNTEAGVTLGEEDAIEESTLIRQDFRETWLFDLVTLDESQTSVKYPVTVPHTITSWRLNAMSLSAKDGLCLMDKPLRLISNKELHIRVDLPYSIVVNEQVEMLVTIFNNGPTRKKVNLFMYGVDGVCSEADAGQKTERRLVTVEPGMLHTEGFALSPIRTGEFKIQVDALAHGTSDVVIKTLHVVPQGITIIDSYAVQLDPRNLQHRQKRSIKRENLFDSIDPDKGEQKTRIDLIPRTQTSAIVPDSEECVVSAIADSLGPSVITTLSNINHLIIKPTGCGEQNVIRMAPTLFTLDYLNATGRLTVTQRETGLKYLKAGYENQMMFRKLDGSFSTFEKRPSSLWLTAFVTRILCKAAPFLGDSLDPEVILTAVDYLVDHQESSPSGSWKEYHPVIHKSALGGLTGVIPITAFTYTTLRSCENFTYPRILAKRRDKSLKLAESYLCGKLTSELAKGDPYHLALLAYSLSTTTCLQSAERRKSIISRLREIGVYSSGENKLFWNTTTPIETTGYVLLALLNLRETKPDEIKAIINYLESQRSYTGAFDATQDTIVALEALSTYAKSAYNLTDINLICNISSGRFRKSIEFHEDNAQVMRTFEINNECDYVDMITRGTGLGSVRVKYKYNVLEAPEKLCGFELDVNVTQAIDSPEQIILSDSDIQLDDLFNITMLAEIGVLNDRLVQVESVVDSTLTDNNDSSSSKTGPSYTANEKAESNLKLSGASKVTNKLTVCAKRFDSVDSGMVILEVGILSGFVPDENDLVALKKNNPFISSYEKTARSVIFYLEDISSKQQYCLNFKIYQENKVANLQSAMVKIYDYYKKGQGCSQLYHSTRRTDYLKKICNSSICHCTARWVCPLNDNLNEVGEIGSVNIIRAKDKFARLLCSGQYGFVWLGRFVKHTELDSLVLLNFKIGQSIYGDGQEGQDRIFTMDRSCFEPNMLRTTFTETFLLMGKSRNTTTLHLDSRSILYDLENIGSKDPKIHYTIKRVIDDFKRTRRQLTC
uniref:Anaphylatoxin-like domain-containing protein n=2 Tax=Tetranychus urticae TaxID=32264 RepID=T1K241_TETUR